VVAVEDDAAPVVVGFSDDSVEFGEDLSRREINHAEDDEVGLRKGGDDIVGVKEGYGAVISGFDKFDRCQSLLFVGAKNEVDAVEF